MERADRFAEIRARVEAYDNERWEGGPGARDFLNSGPDDVLWLLEQLAESDANLAVAKAALGYMASSEIPAYSTDCDEADAYRELVARAKQALAEMDKKTVPNE